MNTGLIYILFSLLISSCGEFNKKHNYQSHSEVNIDSLFYNWNKATLSSLNKSIHSIVDSSERGMYENRLLAFKSYGGFSSDRSVDTASIRYQFLKAISDNVNNRYYVIEANRSGEAVEIRNYLIFLDSENKTEVCTYNYSNGKWIKNNNSERISFYFDKRLKTYFTQFGLGFNQDDVIITEFVGNKVISSEFYLYGTLADTNNLKVILSLR